MSTWKFAAVSIAAVAFAGPAYGALAFSGSGSGENDESISATAEFDFVTHDFGSGSTVDALQITLTNTSGVTNYQANLLTSFFFAVDDSVVVDPADKSADGFDGEAAELENWVDENGNNEVDDGEVATTLNVDIAPANNTDMQGKWALENIQALENPNPLFSGFDYGIGTIGGDIFKGADVQDDNYGIGAETINHNVDGLPNAQPIIHHSAVFWIATPAGLTSLSQITFAAFGFGTGPNYVIFTPEPGSIALTGLGLTLLGFARRIGPGRRIGARKRTGARAAAA
jgi:hypothetical protein